MQACCYTAPYRSPWESLPSSYTSAPGCRTSSTGSTARPRSPHKWPRWGRLSSQPHGPHTSGRDGAGCRHSHSGHLQRHQACSAAHSTQEPLHIQHEGLEQGLPGHCHNRHPCGLAREAGTVRQAACKWVEQRVVGLLAPTSGRATWHLPAPPARQHQSLIVEERAAKVTPLECVLTHAFSSYIRD